MLFRQYLLKVIQPQPANFNVCNFAGLRLLTRLWLGQSHLNEHRFNHNFQNCINPLCTCILEVESVSHFFLHCLHYNDIRQTLLNELKSIDENILKLSGNKLINLLLYGDSKFDSNKNTRLLNAAIKYIIDSGRFTVPLVWYRNEFFGVFLKHDWIIHYSFQSSFHLFASHTNSI